jgi:outer membrane protein assembly factor BamB
MPRYGLGEVTVTTAGGTSAPLRLNALRPGSDTAAVGVLSDLAVDAEGKLWLVDSANPAHLQKVDPATGQVLQSLTLTSAFGSTRIDQYAGLQVLAGAMSLAGTAIPAGSLLLFNGYVNNDRVVAVNPDTGAVLASLTLATNYNLNAGVYDAASGHLFATGYNVAKLYEVDPANGAQLASLDLPIGTSTHAGLAIDPISGNFWIGSTQGNDVVLLDKATGAEIRRVSLALQAVDNNEISGLAFDSGGNLFVASTLGVVYKVDLGL